MDSVVPSPVGNRNAAEVQKIAVSRPSNVLECSARRSSCQCAADHKHKVFLAGDSLQAGETAQGAEGMEAGVQSGSSDEDVGSISSGEEEEDDEDAGPDSPADDQGGNVLSSLNSLR